MGKNVGWKTQWYDELYTACEYADGFSIPGAFFGLRGEVKDDIMQHKSFSFVDQRSGKTVRLYGIVDSDANGVDTEVLVNQIVSDLLPFDRSSDHIMNNDPSDREIYCLLEKVLRNIYKLNKRSTGSVCGSESYSPTGSINKSEGAFEQYSSITVKDLAEELTCETSSQVASASQAVNNPFKDKMGVTMYINFYKDIIKRVELAAKADMRKNIGPSGTNQAEQIHVSSLQSDENKLKLWEEHFQFGDGDSPSKIIINRSRSIPPLYSPRKRNDALGRKLVSRSTSLPTISESIEEWKNETADLLNNPEQHRLLNSLPDNVVVPHTVPEAFQRFSASPFTENPFNSDDEFDSAIAKVAADLGLDEPSEMASFTNEDKASTADSLPSDHTSNYSLLAAAIVFVYGNKMFVGSIGDSRIILLRKRCSYVDVMHLNEAPVNWKPIAAARNWKSKEKVWNIFQEPIVRGGFLVNDSAFYLLLLNNGVITNIVNIRQQFPTSRQINRIAADIALRLINRYPLKDLARRFLFTVMHLYNRKFELLDKDTKTKRDGMSFLFVDLRQLLPGLLPKYDQLLMSYLPQTNMGNATNSYSKMCNYLCRSGDVQEKRSNVAALDSIYNLLQKIFEEKEREQRMRLDNILDEQLKKGCNLHRGN